MGAYPKYVRCRPVKGQNEDMVTLICESWSGGGGATSTSAKSNGAASRTSEVRGPKPSKASGGWNTGFSAAFDARIEKLCQTGNGVACIPSDFDSRVKSWLRAFEKRR